MQQTNLRFKLSSTSNKKLDAQVSKLCFAARRTGAIVLGPVCFKGARMLDVYNATSRTLDALMYVQAIKGVDADILIKE